MSRFDFPSAGAVLLGNDSQRGLVAKCPRVMSDGFNLFFFFWRFFLSAGSEKY